MTGSMVLSTGLYRRTDNYYERTRNVHRNKSLRNGKAHHLYQKLILF